MCQYVSDPYDIIRPSLMYPLMLSSFVYDIKLFLNQYQIQNWLLTIHIYKPTAYKNIVPIHIFPDSNLIRISSGDAKTNSLLGDVALKQSRCCVRIIHFRHFCVGVCWFSDGGQLSWNRKPINKPRAASFAFSFCCSTTGKS